MPAPRSVLDTQGPVRKLERARFQTEQRLARLKERLAQAVEAHRAQIRRSLTSPDPEERQRAERIAVFWEVLPPAEDSTGPHC